MAAIEAESAATRHIISLKLGALGAICGAISWVTVFRAEELHLVFVRTHFYDSFGMTLTPIALYPGLVFGLVFGPVLARSRHAVWHKGAGFALASFFGYFVAYHFGLAIVASLKGGDGNFIYLMIAGMAAGLVGSAVLGLLTKLLFRLIGHIQLVRSIIVGTLAGASFGLLPIDLHNGWGFLAFFVLWQAAYGASLAPLMSSAQRCSRRALLSLRSCGMVFFEFPPPSRGE